VNSLQLADAKYREGNIRRVRELLESCPNDLRGWEWHRLSHILDQSVMTLRGHSDEVHEMAVSPDGKRLVSGGSSDNMIKVWNVETGAEQMTLRGHDNNVVDASFSPDGKRIISGSWDKTVKVWDAANGAELMTLVGHENEVWSVAFSPDGMHIISTSEDKTIRVWDATTGEELMILRGSKLDFCHFLGY
jgi:WD40 repeat protein